MLQNFQKTIDKAEVEQLPQYIYKGSIVVINTEEQAREAIEELKESRIIGFDTETKPSFKKGVMNHVSLIQLSNSEKVFLFRIHLCGLVDELCELFADPTKIKVGVGIRDDIRSLKQISPFTACGFVDLQSFATRVGIEDKSFSKLMAIVFGVRISKRQRVTNWEAPVLSEAQLRYAATDAWGARAMFVVIYKKLMELSKL